MILSVADGLLCEVVAESKESIRCTSLDGEMRIRAGRNANHLAFRLQRLVSLRKSSVDIEQSWIQSVINAKERRERYVITARTSNRFHRIQVTFSMERIIPICLCRRSSSRSGKDSSQGFYRISLKPKLDGKPFNAKGPLIEPSSSNALHVSSSGIGEKACSGG